MADDMFTSFANLYVTRPREAERSDTRLDIRRHDPDQEKRKNDSDEKKQQSLFNEEDYAVVSVEALRMFLKNFIGTLEPDQTRAPVIANDSPRPVHGNAAQAAHAYAHASATKSSGRFAEAPPAASSPTSNAASKLPADDVRIIHRLLEDLKDLSEAGIENLQIERSESFLQSLVSAVAKAQALSA